MQSRGMSQTWVGPCTCNIHVDPCSAYSSKPRACGLSPRPPTQLCSYLPSWSTTNILDGIVKGMQSAKVGVGACCRPNVQPSNKGVPKGGGGGVHTYELAPGSTHRGAQGGGGTCIHMIWRQVVHTGVPKGGGRQCKDMNWRQVVHTGWPKGGGRQLRDMNWRQVVHTGVPKGGGGETCIHMIWRQVVHTEVPKGGGRQCKDMNWRQVVHTGVPKGGGRQLRDMNWRHVVHTGVPKGGGRRAYT